MKVSVSFLSCPKIFPVIERLNLTDADYIHVDLIDNSYVKGTVIPFKKIKKIYKYTSKRLDVHLMVEKPEKYIKKFAVLNTEYLTFHVELGKNIEKNLELIRRYGMKPGLVINPDTDIELLKPYMDNIDMILVMSVMPGYGGQPFMTEVLDKVKKLKNYIKVNDYDIIISIDGGINNDTAKLATAAGVDMLVSGSYITNSSDYQEKITSIRSI